MSLWKWVFLGTTLAASPAWLHAGYGVVEDKGVWWLTRPDGSRMLSLGVDCIGPGPKVKDLQPGKPEYSAELRGESEAAWRKNALKRMKAWGFNTIAGWSDIPLGQGGELPVTPVLHLQASMGSIWWDLWGSDYEGQAKRLAETTIKPYKHLPKILGYFLDNELAWADEHLLNIALTWEGKAPGKQHLVETLQKTYGGSFARFKAHFATQAKDWGSLASLTTTVRKDGHGHRAMDAWTYEVARRYYQVLSAAVRKEDPGKLILGDRYRQFYPQAVARAARGVLDVISTNYESTTPEGWVSPSYFQTLHELSGLPIMVGEYYATARQNRSGLKNSGGAFTLNDTQPQRAAAAASQARQFAAIPSVIGWHWFQYNDEPTYGRGDGEDYNMGLVDIHDQTYAGITASLSDANTTAVSDHAAFKPAPAALELPLAVPLRRGLTADGSLGDWDKASIVPRVLVSASNGLLPFGDFWLGWDEDNLWIAARPYDFNFPGKTPPLAHDERTWAEMQRMKVEVQGERSYDAYAAIGYVRSEPAGAADKAIFFLRPPAKGRLQPAVGSHVDAWHSVWELALPAAELGHEKLKAGTRLKLRLELKNRGDFEGMQIGKREMLEIVLH